MRRMRLRAILVLVNVGLVAVAVVCVAQVTTIRMQRLAEDHALARTRLAALAASNAVARTGDQTVIAARLLAERPTLQQLLRGRDAVAAARFLDRFRETSRLSACAVLADGGIFARSGPPLDWRRLATSQGPPGYVFARPEDGDLLVLASSAPMAGATVHAAVALDEAYTHALSEQVGVSIRILGAERALGDFDHPHSGHRSAALEGGALTAVHLKTAGVYLAVLPLASRAGEPAGILEAIEGHDVTTAAIRRLKRSVLGLALLVSAGAILAGVVIARRIAKPLGDLTEAAARIGGGDLGTPIPRASGFEAGTLAGTMEEMRGRLRRLMAELRQRQTEAEAILTGIVEGVFAVDRERRIQYLNPQAATLLGIAPDEALGRFCGDVLKPQGEGGVRPCEQDCPIVHARFRGNARATEHLLLAGGVRKTVVITSAATAEGSESVGAGDPARQFQVMRDETDMEATRRLRDAVLANISHEFRTPLTAQLASIELLRDRLAEITAPEAEDLVRSLERGSLRLMQLIDNLLESVRIEAGEQSIRRGPVALDEVIEEAMALTSPLIAQREQQLQVDLPYPLPHVRGDAPRLTQVFVNLLANANKFAPPRTTIRIGGAVDEAEVTAWVEDEGPGLGAGTVTRLFAPFARTPDPEFEEEPEPSGMGLGLWIVKSIVERHGGRVEARPAAETQTQPAGAPIGSGTRICVVLPVDGDNEAPRR